ncbi:ATP-binding protein [Streptomyces ficellus]|uniref:ATP-binding protein n=1 Tax=Streptomyces ficellus TaxID=1977088 RepID=A0A6I6F908_9ACTN|nr:ATP-binding protein [Streptomyces ficellus]QGV77437.1 ATP-binding protein [Streptomyces ficellus]
MTVEPAGGPPGTGEELLLRRRFAGVDIPRLRVLVESCAALSGLPEARRGDFVVAMDAVAGNVVQHAGGAGLLVLARTAEELRCRVTDRGPGFTEDVIPDLAPGLNGACRGRGLWLTRLITDRLAVTRGPDGTTVTFAMTLR